MTKSSTASGCAELKRKNVSQQEMCFLNAANRNNKGLSAGSRREGKYLNPICTPSY